MFKAIRARNWQPLLSASLSQVAELEFAVIFELLSVNQPGELFHTLTEINCSPRSA